MGANDEFAEAIIGLAVDLQRVSAAARGRILRMLEQLVTELEEELGKAGLDAVRTSTRLRRAEALLKQVRRTLNRGYGEMNVVLRQELVALAVFVAPEVRVLAREVFKADLFSTIPDERTLRVLARDSIIRGGPARQWWAKQSADTFNRFATELRMGILRGEPTPQIVNRLFGKQVGSIVVSVPVKTRKLKERRGTPPDPTQTDAPKPKKIKTRKVIVPRRTGGVFDTSRREAEALVRTAIQNVSNEVLEQTYEANGDVLRGYQWLATLDTRTCFPAGCPVIMADEKSKPIESIQSGEWVLSGSGTPRRVRAVKESSSIKWMRLTLHDGTTIDCTHNHPFWTRRGWIEAESLTLHDVLGSRGDARPDMSRLREGVSITGFEEEVLLQGMLPHVACGNFSQTAMSVVQGVVPCARHLRSACSRGRTVLLEQMQRLSSQAGTPARSYRKDLRTVWRGVSDPTVQRSGWKASSREKALLQCLSEEAKTKVSMSVLSGGIRGRAVSDTSQVLLSSLLRDDDRNAIGGGCPAGVGLVGAQVRSQSSVPSVEHRFLRTRTQSRNRGRRRLLAFTRTRAGGRSTSRCSDAGGRLDSDSAEVRGIVSPEARGESTSRAVAIPTSWLRIVSIENLDSKKAACYDLEIEEDHSFLVTEARVIAHNSAICRSLDGGSWNINTGLPLPESPVRRKFPGRPPIHFNCRSILTPVIKSWEQLSGGRFTADAFSEGTRASMDGQVPARLNYETWLRKQPKHRQLDVLGPGRYELWKRGLTVRDMVGQDGRPRTIAQLKRLKAVQRKQ